jgi:hypothetical protein
MRRSTYVTLIVVAATGAALATGVAVVEAEIQVPTAETAAVQRAETHALSFDPKSLVGVSSCAASGCHGGAKPLPGTPYDNAAWRSSYVVWATSDPHARAYQTLSTPAAAAIVRKLDRVAADKPVSPQRDLRCTTCHATANPTEPALSSFAADGIGCESCHGAAKQWLGEHFLVRTSESGNPAADASAEKLRLTKLGMLDADNLAVQAQTCVRCHVGDRSGPDGVRDMNHDMIAAGHPALNFEFAAYKRRMPRHWSQPKTDTARAERELQSHTVGQYASAAAALRLSADRAAASLEAPSADGKSMPLNAPWPEFSEYACYRCHHALRSGATADATAQQQFALDRKKATSLPIGNELWGTWNLWHLTQFSGLNADEKPNDLRKLIDKVANPFSAETELRALIKAAEDQAATLDAFAQINALGSDAPLENATPAKLAELLAEIASSAAAGPLSWEEATQAYLACVARYRARRAALGLSLASADDEAGAILKELYETLRFDKPGERRFNSPADYDRAEIKRLFEKLATAAKGGK